ARYRSKDIRCPLSLQNKCVAERPAKYFAGRHRHLRRHTIPAHWFQLSTRTIIVAAMRFAGNFVVVEPPSKPTVAHARKVKQYNPKERLKIFLLFSWDKMDSSG